jgi:hypothetical protein
VDQDLLDRAFHDCFIGNCERAYAHLSELSPTSSLRRGELFHAILYRYDADRLLRADVEPDLSKRRIVYDAVASSPLSDAALRLTAAEHLARLGAENLGTAAEVALNAVPDAEAARAREAADLAARARSKDPAVLAEVRAKIEPRIFSGKATAADVALLRGVCQAQKDAACQRQLDRLMVH